MTGNIYDFLKPSDLQVYCKKPESQNDKPSYRTVFDVNEITVLYIDFHFHNKKYDEIDWDTQFDFVAYKLYDGGREEVTSWVVSKTISSNENNVMVSDYWGEEGTNDFWDEGEYEWEVWHEDTLIAQCDFYIQNIGPLGGAESYLDFLSLKLFEGPAQLPVYGDRKYLSTFWDKATRCIWVEFEFANLSPFIEWKGEFFFHFYNDMKELVGSMVKLEDVISKDQNNTYTVYAWKGDNTNATWEQDKYTVEVVFMDTVIAVASFEVADLEHRGELNVEARLKRDVSVQLAEPISDEESIFEEMDQLVGLRKIKENLREYYTYAQYVQLRKAKGIEDKDEVNLHFVFTGNPGTGKTTVARMLGKLYKELGLLPKDTVFEVDRSHLIGRYIGETAPQTKEVIEKARGGILFIDEAYALYRKDDDKDFGKEAIEVLMKELSDGPGNISIVVAGYPKEMKDFLESNPGLRSRFNNHYEFDDYTPEELLEIAERMADKKSLIISGGAKKILYKIITDEYRKREKTFGNARYVSSLIEEAQINLGLRVMQNSNPADLSLKALSTLENEDIERMKDKSQGLTPEFPVDEELLKESLQQLNALIGLSVVKAEIMEIVKLVRFFKENRKHVINSLSLHNVFAGSPGTGKTTVARILANIYKALGLLEKGHLVECGRDSLVAGYVGQTAIKTKEKIDEAMGGVLFIDEAYALTRNSGGNDFGPEAIEIILQTIENYRGKFALIAAGYTEEMAEFIRSNPGLKSRFDNFINFKDYSPSEMMMIAEKMLSDKKINIEEDAKQHLENYFSFHYKNKDKFFGNARFVRKIIEQSIRNIYVRLSDIKQEERTEEMLSLLTLKDVEEFVLSKGTFLSQKRKMGF